MVPCTDCVSGAHPDDTPGCGQYRGAADANDRGVSRRAAESAVRHLAERCMTDPSDVADRRSVSRAHGASRPRFGTDDQYGLRMRQKAAGPDAVPVQGPASGPAAGSGWRLAQAAIE